MNQFIQPVLTIALLTFAYGGLHVLREGSVTTGLRMAFFDSDLLKAEQHRSREDAMVQAELHHSVVANKVIDQLLETLLQRAGSAARARLDVIHNGVTGLTGTGLLRYDVTNSVASPGRSAGAMVANRPMSEWTDILPALLAGQCLVRRSDELRSHAVRARLEAMGATTLLACPASDVHGRLLGAVFVLWDLSDPVPQGEAMASVIALGQRVGAQIATILDLRGPPPWPVPKQ